MPSSAHFSHTGKAAVFDRLLDVGRQQLVGAQPQLLHRVLQPFHRIGQKGCVVGKADEAIGMPTAHLGQMVVAAAGDKADGADAVLVQFLDPAPRLLAVARMRAGRLRLRKAPHAPPMFAVRAGSAPA
jgi:hypothetical protein